MLWKIYISAFLALFLRLTSNRVANHRHHIILPLLRHVCVCLSPSRNLLRLTISFRFHLRHKEEIKVNETKN